MRWNHNTYAFFLHACLAVWMAETICMPFHATSHCQNA